MKAKQMDIVIIGGGAAGLTLACLLGGAGLNVTLVDPSKPLPLKKTKVTGRTVALMDSSLNILKATGVWDKLIDHSCALEMMRIVDDSLGTRDTVEVDFPASDIGLNAFGYNVPNGLLRAALFERVKKIKSVDFIESRFYDYIQNDGGILVRLENKTEIQAQLLVGADGRKSAVRAAAKIEAQTKHYDQSAITCVINHSRSHENISTEFHRTGGPMAIVPMLGNQSSIVWVNDSARADDLLKMKKQDFQQALQDKTHNILGGITLETGPEAWPLCSIKAKSITAPRVALVAEAAHVMSPITAQGLNLSLRDVTALAESVIDSARLGVDIGNTQTLRTYEKRRRLDIETRVFGVDGMNNVVSTDKPALKRLRRAGLKTLNSPLPFKTLAMHIGLAPKLDMGRLAQGEAL